MFLRKWMSGSVGMLRNILSKKTKWKMSDFEQELYWHPGKRFGEPIYGIRMIHKETGLSAYSQTKRSQHANRLEAFRILCEKLDS